MRTTSEQINNVAYKVLELKEERKKHTNEKMGIQSELASLKEKYSGLNQNSDEFKKVKRERMALKTLFQEHENAIIDLNQQIKKYNVMHSEAIKMYGGESRVIGVKERLAALLKKYKGFAKDRTRVSSMRIMANEIADEIEGILIKS